MSLLLGPNFFDSHFHRLLLGFGQRNTGKMRNISERNGELLHLKVMLRMRRQEQEKITRVNFSTQVVRINYSCLLELSQSKLVKQLYTRLGRQREC